MARKCFLRYRKLGVRTWSDANFRGLSGLAPSGQALWLYLVLGPHNTSLPGLFRASEVVLADELGWPVEDFRRCWAEIEGRGMARADWKARVVWVPSAIEDNEPESPNVVTGWKNHVAEVPDCDLKAEACAAQYAYVVSQKDGDGWRQAAATAFGEQIAGVPAVGNTRGKAFPQAFPQALGKPVAGAGAGIVPSSQPPPGESVGRCV